MAAVKGHRMLTGVLQIGRHAQVASNNRQMTSWNSYHFTTGDGMPGITDPVTLLNMRFCPFAQRTVLALAAKNVEYTNINVKLMNKPEWLWEFNPFGKVPVLFHGGRVIYESVITCDYIDEVFPGVKLNPKDPGLLAEERMVLELFSSKIALPHMKIWFGFKRGEGSDKRSMHFNEALDNIEKILEHRLTKLKTKFFHGDSHPGMLDYFLWPWFERIDAYSLVFPGEGLDYPSHRFRHITAWMDRMKEERSVAPYLIDRDTHAAFVASMQSGNPDYDMMLNK